MTAYAAVCLHPHGPNGKSPYGLNQLWALVHDTARPSGCLDLEGRLLSAAAVTARSGQCEAILLSRHGLDMENS